ncbi:MAG: CsgG/HfaB family protein [Verrucomicrobiota bacterium]
MKAIVNLSTPFMAVMWAFTLAVSLQVSAQDIRIGILASDALAQPGADLLTAALTSTPGIAILERTELNKILQEQAVNAVGKQADLLQVGKLAGADGLIVMEPVTIETNQVLVVRLVAVGPGVTLRVAQFPLPLRQIDIWADEMSKQFRPHYPKLAVLRREAVPISILNLHSAISSPAGTNAERELTRLLAARLTNEKEVFVLERRQMSALSWEKELKGIDETGFWNGSYVLDGTIDRDGMRADTVTVHARLVPPDQGQAISLEVAGPRDRMPAVVDELVKKTLARLNRPSQPAPWDAGKEAVQYQDEAAWALRWGMLAEAQQAAEAAWALGQRTVEMSALRIACYRADGVTPTGFGHDLSRNRIWAASAPEPRKLGSMIRAVELYLEHGRAQGTADWMDGGWYVIGMQILGDVSQVLKHYYYHFRARIQQEEDVARLRKVSRELAALLTVQQPRLQRELGKAMSARLPTGGFGRLASLDELKFQQGCFWQDSPEGCLALYKELLGKSLKDMPEDKNLFGEWLMFRFGERPHGLIAWEFEERSRLRSLWLDFLGKSTAADDPAVQIEAAWLLFFTAVEAHAVEQPLDDLFRLMLAHPDMFAWLDAANPLVRISGPITARVRAYAKQAPQLEAKFTEFKRQFPDALAKARLASRGEAIKRWRLDFIDYLRKATTHDSVQFNAQVSLLEFDPAQLLEVHAALQTYRARMGKLSFAADMELERMEVLVTAHLTPVEAIKAYLRTATVQNDKQFVAYFLRRDYAPEEAKEILSLFPGYCERVKTNQQALINAGEMRLKQLAARQK